MESEKKKILKGVSLKLEGDQFHTIFGTKWKWKDQLAETLLSTGKAESRFDFFRWEASRPNERQRNGKADGSYHAVQSTSV